MAEGFVRIDDLREGEALMFYHHNFVAGVSRSKVPAQVVLPDRSVAIGLPPSGLDTRERHPNLGADDFHHYTWHLQLILMLSAFCVWFAFVAPYFIQFPEFFQLVESIPDLFFKINFGVRIALVASSGLLYLGFLLRSVPLMILLGALQLGVSVLFMGLLCASSSHLLLGVAAAVQAGVSLKLKEFVEPQMVLVKDGVSVSQ